MKKSQDFEDKAIQSLSYRYCQHPILNMSPKDPWSIKLNPSSIQSWLLRWYKTIIYGPFYGSITAQIYHIPPEEHHCSVLSWPNCPGGRGRQWRVATNTGLSSCYGRQLTEADHRCSCWGWTCLRLPCRSLRTGPGVSLASRCRGNGREPGPRLHPSRRERWNRGRGSCPSWCFLVEQTVQGRTKNNYKWNTKNVWT